MATKPKAPEKPKAYIVRRSDGSTSFKIPGRKPYVITPGQVTNMQDTIDAESAALSARYTVEIRDAK